MREGLDEARLRRLIDVGRSLVSELDLEAVLTHVLDVARELTGAQYAVIGVLDESRRGLERYHTRGVDPGMRGVIGDLPGGRGFLAVPIAIRGSAWGDLYLTDKQAGEPFDAGDERAAVILADWAAVAIENADLYHRLETRRDELERVVHTLEATTAIARAVGAETQLDRVLELIVQRGRALVAARAMVILLREGDELVVVACAGEVEPAVIGRRIPIEESSTAGELLRSTGPERLRDVASRPRLAPECLGVHDAQTALLVPLEFRGRRLGALAAFDHIGGEPEFEQEQEGLLLSFAASAATAVATAQTVEQERLRDSMAAAERERRRWARELHDETLQGLAGFHVLLNSALRRGDADQLERAVRSAVEQIGTEIEKLRMLITELRPSSLDELGLQPALESLASRVAAVEGLEVETQIGLADGERLAPDIETTVYRLAQEALTNVVKHAAANRVTIEIALADGVVELTVCDDGAGFDTAVPREGFGIIGMRERVALCDGTLEILSGAGAGTAVRARLRVRAQGPLRVA